MTTTGPDTKTNTTFFKDHFSRLKEPRRTTKGNIRYSLEEILFLTISAVISGCNTWTSIQEFGEQKIDWLRKFYKYTHKTPSHDAISDLFSILDKNLFAECFMNWVNSIANLTDSEVVAFDGKTIRGVASSSRKFPLHVVTAFCTKNRISLGQETVEDKSNEIIAIPKLLDILTLNGCIVTIDAMGCQKKIAEKIIEKNANYILQVKDNQKELKEQIEKIFKIQIPEGTHIDVDMGHGRIETRKCDVISDLRFLDEKEEWKGLNTIVRISSIREIKKTGVASTEFRYYISSLIPDAECINKSVRSHWGIENDLHWNLDVIFKEDGALKRIGNSAENFNIISKVALGLIENEKSVKLSKPLKRLRASLNDAYREKIMKV
jgi:predicted transposase YbfD/YdcC